MTDNNFRKNKIAIYFDTLQNAQNINKISKIFAKDKLNYELKPNPYFVIVVGAPGVGKTTKSNEIIKKELGLQYKDFYNISLDSLVERVKPYRESTKRLYNTLKAKKNVLRDLNEKNFGLLSEMYLPTIMSINPNFSIKQSETKKLAKIDASNLATVPLKLKPSQVPSGLKHLNDLRKEGLIYGVKNGLNIIYDTTLTKTKDKIKSDIMPVLEMNKQIKYNIIVILVTAESKNIQNRIKKRHNEMLSENNSYIRAINPNLTDMFIKDNKEGFNNAKKYFKSKLYETDVPLTIYEAKDFKFIEVENTNKNRTIKNNFNNFNFKYF